MARDSSSQSQEGRQGYIRNLERLLAPEATYLLYVFLKKSRTELGPGVAEDELAAFPPPLRLTARQDGIDRGHRPSAWLTYRRV